MRRAVENCIPEASERVPVLTRRCRDSNASVSGLLSGALAAARKQQSVAVSRVGDTWRVDQGRVDAADLVVVPHDLLKGLRGRQTTNRVADRPGDEQEHDWRAGQQDHEQKALETTLEQHREPKRAA